MILVVLGYVMRGEPPVGFLRAVMANDLVHSAAQADMLNQRKLFQWAQLLYNLPAACWGSEELVDKWCAAGGIDGMRKAREQNRPSTYPTE